VTSLFASLRQIAAYARKSDFSIPCANIADALDRVLESHSNDELRVGNERLCPVYGEARGTSECEKCGGDIINCPVYGPGEKRRREESHA
jgi:hypothetical protein